MARFVSVDPLQHRFRGDELRWQPALWGGVLLVRTWGAWAAGGGPPAITTPTAPVLSPAPHGGSRLEGTEHTDEPRAALISTGAAQYGARQRTQSAAGARARRGARR
jgi:hypothetical protein